MCVCARVHVHVYIFMPPILPSIHPGGKWTTYRSMAEETLDAAVKAHQLPSGPCRTVGLLLEGARGWTPTLFIRLVQDYGLENEVAQHLAATYGGKAFEVAKMAQVTGQRWPIVGKRLVSEFPYIEAEVRGHKNPSLPFLSWLAPSLMPFYPSFLPSPSRCCTPSKSTPAPPSMSSPAGRGWASSTSRRRTRRCPASCKSWLRNWAGARSAAQ